MPVGRGSRRETLGVSAGIAGGTKNPPALPERVTALRVIPCDSLDAWLADGPSRARAGARQDFFDVIHGRVALRLPDGKRYWLPVWGYAYAQHLDRRLGEALLGAVMDHTTVADHDGPTPIFFDVRTNDLGSAYCARCRRSVNLNADVERMGRLRFRELNWREE